MAAVIDGKADLAFGVCRLDRRDERLIGPAGPIRIGHKAYRVLLMLAEQNGRLLTKEALFTSVWDGTIVSESALTSVIKELRRALGDESRTPSYIESVYGRGYRLIPTVTACGSSPQQTEAPARAAAVSDVGTFAIGDPPLLYIPAFGELGAADAHPQLAAVLREEIIFALSRFRDLRLVSDAQAQSAPPGSFEGRDYQLQVRLVHSGTAAKAFVRLSRLSSGEIVSAESAELSSSGMGANVEHLVRCIVTAALPRLQEDLLRQLPAQPHSAYDLHLSYKLRLRDQIGHEDAQNLVRAWERLIEAHPSFGPAYPPLIRLYNTDFCYTGLGASGSSERARAYTLAERALAIDPIDSHFHTLAGWCHLWAGEGAAAREQLEEALSLNPFHQERVLQVAAAFLFLDHLDRAAELFAHCRSLTPFASSAEYEDEGLMHMLAGRYELARTRLALVTSRTLSSDLYALLTAAALGAPETAARSRAWRGQVHARWAAPEPLSRERLTEWVLYQHPFQSASRREWIVETLGKALDAEAVLQGESRPSAEPVQSLAGS